MAGSLIALAGESRLGGQIGILGIGKSQSSCGIGVDPDLDTGLLSRAPRYLAQPSTRHRLAGSAVRPRFTPAVTYGNEKDGDQLKPRFATPAELVKLAIARRQKYGYRDEQGARLATPAGYTLTDLKIRIINLRRQWRKKSTSHYWQYFGGDICLELKITVFVTTRAESRQGCIDLIMAHEMLHVADEINIATNVLPKRLPHQKYMKSYFASLIADRDFRRLVAGDGQGRGSQLEEDIQRIAWVPESGRMAAELHAAHPAHAAEIEECLRR